jgi:uncharacterized protein YraI
MKNNNSKLSGLTFLGVMLFTANIALAQTAAPATPPATSTTSTTTTTSVRSGHHRR